MIAGGVPSGAKHRIPGFDRHALIARLLQRRQVRHAGRARIAGLREQLDLAARRPAARSRSARGTPTLTCPATRSLIAWPAPRYGTWSSLMSAALANHSISTCWFEPTPEVAQPVPGGFFTAATSSAIEFTSNEGCTANTCGWRPSRLTGTRSLRKSTLELQHMRRARHVVVGEQERIAVGRRLDRGVDADGAAGAGAVLDEHLLAERRARRTRRRAAR